MITNVGQSIIIKYLLGQAPAYASYIAVGCGAKPVSRILFSVNTKAIEDHVAKLGLTATHNLSVGDYITVSNVDTTFDGVHQITSVSGTTVSYALPNASNVASFASPTTVSPVGSVARNYSTKKNLDFEMFRVPITSRGYVSEDGIPKVVLTGNIPSSDRYEITELGVYSAASNPSAQLSDSRNLYLFVDGEGWEYHTPSAVKSIPIVSNKLDLEGTSGAIYLGSGFNSEITSTNAECFIADSSNATFESEVRISRQERTRNLGPSIFLRGDSSTIIKTASITSVTPTATTATYTTTEKTNLLTGDSVVISGLSPSGYNGTFTITSVNQAEKTFTVSNTTNDTVTDSTGSVVLPRFATASGSHIHNASNVNLTLNNNSPIDELRLAFSIVSTDPSSTGESVDEIGAVRLSVAFEHTHQSVSTEDAFAQMDVELTSTVDFSTNRYFVVSQRLQDLKTYGNFSWPSVNIVSVSATVLNASGVPTNKYFVAIDGLRLENVSADNPLYGLVGYSVVQNPVQGTSGTYPKPIIKLPNTSNFIEFRYSVDVI